MINLKKNYNTIAIIGCQSSGKSTLLNNLFNTKFDVMIEDKGRGQTTQGIWVSSSIDYQTMVVDCEGTDSKERGEDRFKFEHCSSLFCLAVADVLIVNMWTNDVGRYTASNYGVLKMVFEMNLKLFQQECAKRILIVLRDFDERYDVKEKITELIMQDIFNIWRDIKKPEKYKDYSPDKFFEFEFTTLSHKFYFEDKFMNEIGELRKRLSPDHNQFLFKHVSAEKTVPADGISIYCNQIWNSIISDKDLNIPTQKEMLANYRCNEIKENALQSVDSLVDNFILDSASRLMDNFKSRCEDIENAALAVYDETAKNYVKNVYLDIRRQLINALAIKLYVCFDNQAKKLVPTSQKNMRQELEKELKNSILLCDDNFFECAVTIKKSYLNSLIRKLEFIRVFENWELSINEYEELFDEIIESQRKFSLENKKNEIIKKMKSVLDDSLIQNLEEISPYFWNNFNIEYFNHFNYILFSFKEFLSEYYKMNDSEFEPFIEDIENEIFIGVKKDLKKKIREIPNYAVESFRRGFWYDDNIPRVWNKINENEIIELFSKYKKHNLFIFELFKKIKLLKNPLKYFNYIRPNEEVLKKLLNNLKFLIEENDTFEDLVTDSECKLMIAKYEENIEAILEDSKRRHSNIQKPVVPLWAWILIIYLGYEDVYRLFQSYWIIPVIILLSIYGTLSMMGMGHVPKMIFNIIKTTLSNRK